MSTHSKVRVTPQNAYRTPDPGFERSEQSTPAQVRTDNIGRMRRMAITATTFGMTITEPMLSYVENAELAVLAEEFKHLKFSVRKQGHKGMMLVIEHV